MASPSGAPTPPRPAPPGLRPATTGLPKSALDVRLVARPTTPAETVKTLALDAVYGTRSWLSRTWEDFRKSDRFFKYKAGIVGGWLVISVLTFVGTCLGGEKSAIDVSNSIGAMVKYQTSAELGVSAILIENQSRDQWKQVALSLDDRYFSLLPQVDAGGRAVVELRKFNGPKGETPPPGFRPQKLDIRCSEGRATVDLRDNS